MVQMVVCSQMPSTSLRNTASVLKSPSDGVVACLYGLLSLLDDELENDEDDDDDDDDHGPDDDDEQLVAYVALVVALSVALNVLYVTLATHVTLLASSEVRDVAAELSDVRPDDSDDSSGRPDDDDDDDEDADEIALAVEADDELSFPPFIATRRRALNRVTHCSTRYTLTRRERRESARSEMERWMSRLNL